MKNKRKWNRKAAILAAAVLTSTCFFVGNIPAYADGTTVPANVTGGLGNTASGENSSVSGGRINIASGEDSSISGGDNNFAAGDYSSVVGGSYNIAGGYKDPFGGNLVKTDAISATVSGGTLNAAAGGCSSVSGGRQNTASADSSSVSGGLLNTASGFVSSVSGGHLNASSGTYSSVSGGANNTASGTISSVSGGSGNIASGVNSSVSGGASNIALGMNSSVNGGSVNHALGDESSISGGQGNVAWGQYSSISGGFDNLTIGKNSYSAGGLNSIVQGNYSTGIGGGSTGADAEHAVAIGYQSIAIGKKSIAIGWDSVASEPGVVSFGHKANDVSGYTVTWTQRTDKDSAGNIIKNADGTTNDYTKAPTITATTYSSDSYNRLVNVADGEDDHDVATVGQLNKKLDADASNVDLDAWAKKLGTGKIASGDTGLVTGGTVYTEVRPTTDGNYIHTASTTAANLKALDTQVKGNADHISTINTTLSGLGSNYSKTDLSNLNDTGKATIRDLSKSAVKVVDGKNTKVTTGKSGDATTYAVDVDTDAVTDTVKADMKTDLDNKASVDASNINAGIWAKKLGTGKIASGDTGLVTGGTVYTEVRPTTDGNYIHTASTTAANLKALDTQVKGNANHISTINTTLSGLGTSYSKTDLSNLNDNGKATIRDLSKSAVKVVDGKNTKVTTGKSGDATTYAVDVDTDAVTDTVKAGMKTELDTKANVNASNIDAGVWATKLGTGTIASGNTGLVTGGTVYTEVRPTTDGNYIHTASTTAANLKALDMQVKGNANSISTINTTVDNLNNTVSNLSTTGFSGDMKNKKITNLADGTDKKDAVNKSQMDKADADTLSLAKTYTNTAVNTAKDAAIDASKDYTDKTVKTAFEQSKNYTDEKVSNINNSIKNLQDSDGLNVKYTDNTKKNVALNNAKIQNLGSGNIKDGSTDAVNGGDVYKYVKDHANGGVEVDDKGNSVVNKNFIVNGDTTIKGDTNLQNTTVNKKLTVAEDTDLQNTTVNQKLTVNGDTNLQNTTVNKNLTVSGDTDLQNTTVNKDLTVNGYTTLGQTTINKQLAVQGNTYISQNLAVGGNATVAQNLVVGNTIAAKQVVADDAIIGGRSVIDEFNRQREDTDRVGAGAAALAALQYLPYEDGSKLVGGAGYGHYRGKNAGAVGLRYYPNRDVAFSMASTVGNGDTMLNAGVSFRIGSGTGSVHSIPDTNKVLKETQALNKALAERLDKVEKELKQSNDTNEELMKRLAALEAKMK